MTEIRSFDDQQDHPNELVQPHSVEAEQQVLGALLVNNSLFQKVSDILTSEIFYDPVHAKIFEAIVDKIEAGNIASPVTLRPVFDNYAPLNELGGPVYLVRLAGASISSNFIRDYCEMVSDLSIKRQILENITDAKERVIQGSENSTSIALGIETKAGALLSVSKLKPIIRTHMSAVVGAVNRINDSYTGKKEPGISTGIPQLDDKLGFFRSGQMIVLAGRPAMGKTTVAQNFAWTAMQNGIGVFFGSLEMTGEELATRFLSKGLAESGIKIPYHNMTAGRISEAEMRNVVEEAKRQESLPLIVSEREVRECSKMRSAVRRAQQKLEESGTPLGLVIIDYVQKMSHDRFYKPIDIVGAASDLCKSLAMDLNLPVIALGQLNRTVEARDPPVPMLSDLRESGKLEEDADVALFCYREAYYLQRQIDALKGGDVERENDLRFLLSSVQNNIDIIVSKQRSGPTGTVKSYIEPGLCHVHKDKSAFVGELI